MWKMGFVHSGWIFPTLLSIRRVADARRYFIAEGYVSYHVGSCDEKVV